MPIRQVMVVDQASAYYGMKGEGTFNQLTHRWLVYIDIADVKRTVWFKPGEVEVLDEGEASSE